jgi:iron(III) transport system ATP-binding protein
MNDNGKNEAVGVEIKDLSKVFLEAGKTKSFTAVNNISLDITPGQLVTLLGPSGCGKTTILRMLSGFTSPTTGRILFDGKNVTDVPPNRRDVGMMFQSYALFPHLTVYENIAYGLKVKKIPAEQLKERMANILTLMHIGELKDRIPEQLSGGQQQRVALARAIVTEPKILLFDEPLSNLDAKMREYMRDELRKLQQRVGITSIYVTHDQAEAMTISDKIVIMNKGLIEQMGSPFEIYTCPDNQFVANFMGKANFVNTEALAVNAGFLEVRLAGKLVRLKPNQSLPLKQGDKVCCMIRPEFMHIEHDGKFSALIKHTSYFGNLVEYTIETGGETLLMTDSEIRKNGVIAAGTKITVSIDENLIRPLAP